MAFSAKTPVFSSLPETLSSFPASRHGRLNCLYGAEELGGAGKFEIPTTKHGTGVPGRGTSSRAGRPGGPREGGAVLNNPLTFSPRAVRSTPSLPGVVAHRFRFFRFPRLKVKGLFLQSRGFSGVGLK